MQSHNNDNDFLTKWNDSEKKYLGYKWGEEMRWDNNNEDDWGDLECL